MGLISSRIGIVPAHNVSRPDVAICYLSSLQAVMYRNAHRLIKSPSRVLNKSLGVIVIGNEILRGDTVDTNFAFVAKKAPSYGLVLKKVSVIPDVPASIADEVRNFSTLFDVVVTSGGIGSTHDDCTFEAVAEAFNDSLCVHPSLLDCIATLYNCKAKEISPDDSRLRLARVPSDSKLIYGADPLTGQPSFYPVVRTRNVFILPGVPKFFRQGFGIIKPHIRDPNVKFFGKNFYCTCEETDLATRLTEFAAKHSENLLIGSYPVTNNSYYKVRISLESQDRKVLEEASEAFTELLSGELVSYDPDPVSHAAARVYELAKQDSDFGRKVASAVRIVEEGLQKYGKEKVMLSFNGGKDCTALLHILFAVLNKSTVATSSPSFSSDDSDENELTASAPVTFSHPRLLYVRVRSPFPETEVFVQSVLRYYHYPSAAVKRRFLSCDWFGDFSVLSAPLSNNGPNATETSFLLIYEGPIKAGLVRLKTDAPDVEAIFMGTRSSDPWAASTTVMMPTDPGWPQYMRIHPILDWTYADVWRFIRELSLPYCCLYDCGYTSLGSLEDTHPNPDLRIISPTGLTAYQPAYMLKNPLSERSGRISSTRKSQSE